MGISKARAFLPWPSSLCHPSFSPCFWGQPMQQRTTKHVLMQRAPVVDPSKSRPGCPPCCLNPTMLCWATSRRSLTPSPCVRLRFLPFCPETRWVWHPSPTFHSPFSRHYRVNRARWAALPDLRQISLGCSEQKSPRVCTSSSDQATTLRTLAESILIG